MKKDYIIKLLNRQSLAEIEIIIAASVKQDVENLARQFNATHSIVSIRERK